MVLLALCVPIAMMLLLLGMEMFEDFLSRSSPSPSPDPSTIPENHDDEPDSGQE
ncbi:hypothetical protein ACTMTU_17970 [Streptomyces sp. OZ13]|jgi:hypothetical protein|uniref:hypothetical protein n=1 Tax=Streptomyces sp. OZ13 TaxID=3452210 RepID=UPI003F8BD662